MVNKEGKQETQIDHFPSQCDYALLVFFKSSKSVRYGNRCNSLSHKNCCNSLIVVRAAREILLKIILLNQTSVFLNIQYMYIQ